MAVLSSGGRHAITHYRVLARYRAHTLLAVMLETGRTHQIRVHMAPEGHPIVGDQVYAGRPRVPRGAAPELLDCLRGFHRQALHAFRLRFAHPASGQAAAVRGAAAGGYARAARGCWRRTALRARR